MTSADIPRFIIGGFFLLFGPVALVAYGVYAFTVDDVRTATTSANIVRYETHHAGDLHTTCPVLAFSVDGRDIETESARCDLDPEPPIGAQISVLYDPADPEDVCPAEGYTEHPEAIPLVAVTLLCSAVAAFFLWPKPKKPAAST